jgi:hypothetical protein
MEGLRKITKNSVKKAGVLAEIRTEDLLNTIIERYHCANPPSLTVNINLS